MANRIGCRTEKTVVVDPNMFDGQNSSSNVSVQLDDLNISVILETFKKGRTVLTATSKESNSQTSNDLTVNFMDGKTINDKKVLTTSYTDLTTIFDDNSGDSNSENLGITSIDIDFNSSYAPMVTINFIDLRGSSIFQNEENISGNNSKNKYAAFFQLPYPLFQLTIKGYYGKPVKYCLHLTKFTSKFNSKTGNFEITCSFIGYTYAMLSDMLIGYLKAIPYTEKGKKRYEAINATRGDLGEIINLNTLMKRINEINTAIEKLKATDVDAFSLKNIELQKQNLDAMLSVIRTYGQGVDMRYNPDNDKNLEKYDYVVQTSGKAVDAYTEAYNLRMKENIKTFNDYATGVKLEETEFLPMEGYTITKQDLIDNTYVYAHSSSDDIINYMDKDTTLKTIANDLTFTIYDFKYIYKKITDKKNDLDNLYKTNEKSLAETIRLTVKDKIGFDPTIRNIIEVFTTAVEVFMEVIFEVSQNAEGHPERISQLKDKFGTDLTKSDYTTGSPMYAWPDYREEDGGILTEKYLGVINFDDPQSIDELVFIDDLLNAFIKAEKEAQAVKNDVANDETNWYPINPIDTRLFKIDKQPYKRIEGTSVDEVCKLMLIRGMTFLGYSNNYLSDPEITAMANAEADAILNNIGDDSTGSVRAGLGVLTLDLLKETKAVVNTDFVTNKDASPIITEKNNIIYYTFFWDYTHDGRIVSVLPINDNFGGQWSQENTTTLDDTIAKADSGTIFLTNYNSQVLNDDYKNDGAKYLQIFTTSEYTGSQSPLVGTTEAIDSSVKKILYDNINVTSLTDIPAAGFNAFAGPYGIQDYSKMDWGTSMGDLKDLPLMYLFYGDYSVGNEYFYGLTHESTTKPRNISFDIPTNNTVSVAFTTVLQPRHWEFGNMVNNNERAIKFVNGQINFEEVGENKKHFSDIFANVHPVEYYGYPYVVQRIDEDSLGTVTNRYNYFSLFGHPWFYAQTKYPKYSKALLFLNTLPWNGMPFEKQAIKNLFKHRSGFIHVPKLWCVFLGGLLWRLDFDNPQMNGDLIVGGGSGNEDPIQWYYKDTNGIERPWLNKKLTKSEWKAPNKFFFINDLKSVTGPVTNSTQLHALYKSILDVLPNNLPNQIKDEFKRIFFEFVNDGDWDKIYDSLKIGEKIVNGKDVFNGIDLYDKIQLLDDNTPTSCTKQKLINNHFLNIGNYKIMSPAIKLTDIATNQMFLEIDTTKKGNISQVIIKMMMEEVVIANNAPFIWDETIGNTANSYYPIFTSSKRFNNYFQTILTKLHDKSTSYDVINSKKQLEQSAFLTSNEDVIKLQLYRTCKNTYDKWLGGATNIDDIIFQCGKSNNDVETNGLKNRNDLDAKLATHNRPSDNKVRLIDSFRFVSRSFMDIGNLLYINPTPVLDYLTDSPKASFYDVVGNLLSSNNFDFIALPTFINYNDDSELNAIFEPYGNYEDAIKGGICGPSFVCVYVGQTSKHLDFSNSEYTNDGIDFQCDADGNFKKAIPNDFITKNKEWENNVAVFSVNYSQQNQSIFKDITLDQSEFSETDESLQITDNISTKGAENNRSLAGQNIFNVYGVRSYKAEVEMLGNAMIQPMMYFQLNNIPMFHGGYMITRVRHSIKPNNMSTSFTGVRIRFPETQLLTGADFYMSLIDSMNLSEASGGGATGGGQSAGTFPPIVATIIHNGGQNGAIEAGANGNIKIKVVPSIAGVATQVAGRGDGMNGMLSEATDALVEMLKAFVIFAKSKSYPTDGKGNYISINSLFRTIAKQKELAAGNHPPGSVAIPGRSNHGWGIAVDLAMISQKDSTSVKKGDYFPISSAIAKQGFNLENNPSLKWFLDNGWKYGFVIPWELRDETGANEFWHFEYHGTTAICLLNKHPTVYGYRTNASNSNSFGGGNQTTIGLNGVNSTINTNTDNGYKSIVINPKGAESGKPVTYADNICDYIYVQGTSSDGVDVGSVPTKNIYDELKRQLKLSDEATAGIMGNLFQESRFNPTALNTGGGDYGLAQWIHSRKTDLLNYLAKYGLDKTSYIDQITYLNYDLNKFKATKAVLEKPITAEEAARIWFLTFERTTYGIKGWTEAQIGQEKYSGDLSLPKRKGYATQIMKMIKSKNFSVPKDIA